MQILGCQNFNNKIGILVAQLGTPDAPDKKALKPYLKEFLSDRRIVEKPAWLWWPILNLIILTLRPAKSAKLYERIWQDEGSPLLVYTKSIVEKLQSSLHQEYSDLEVEYGMRYGSHNIETAINKLIKKGCRRIVVFNMYPQYSATTVGSNLDAVFTALKKQRWVPSLRVVEPYYNNPAYLDVLANSIKNSLQDLDFNPDKLVLSYHGIPQEYAQKGDPYCCMCNITTKLLSERLELPEDFIIHTFQSRFGRDPWLQPYTDETIEDLPEKDCKNIAVACPGFTTDCLETLDEIGNEAHEEFVEAGGEKLSLLPCLNDSPEWIELMKQLILQEISGWLEQDQYKNLAGFPCSCGLDKKSCC